VRDRHTGSPSPRRGRCGLLTDDGKPAVSIIIPLYNKAPYIKRAVRSVLAQAEQEFEVIVVDDGSTDGGAAIVEHFADSRIRLITQENRGASAARNRGIQESGADLVAFLDADDEWCPTFLETVLDLCRRYPEAGVYATAYTIYNPDGVRRGASIAAVPPAPWSGLIPNYFRSAALGEPPISSSSVAIPRTVLQEMDGFSEEHWWGEDVDLWGRIAFRYPIAFTWRVGAVYHTDVASRACTRVQPVPENPFVASARQAVERGLIPPEMLDGVLEYVAAKQLQTAARNIQAGRPDLARANLSRCPTRMYRRRKIAYSLMALIPAPWYRRYRHMKAALTGRH
jgi:cellulose synthase/poly-beta-1,6-N-acetylglucosamine synthase-like glycosyltransferase